MKTKRDYNIALDDDELHGRLFDRISMGDECWDWMGGTSRGYGQIEYKGLAYQAHRLVYVMLVRSIPPELDPDHTCRRRICVRPGHIDIVTPEENGRRANLGRAPVTQCPSGHPYDEVNTYVAPSGWRQCRTCRKRHTAKGAKLDVT